ncbi:MAG: formate dehydrogenase subunit alpha [Desulfobacterales bacterium]
MSDKELKSTVCPYCGVGCGFYVRVQDKRAVGLEYMTDHPVCNGRLCAKGNAALEILNHPDRLKRPMKKVDSRWEQVSWEAAIDTVADKLQSIGKAHSPDATAFLASAKCTNEENYVFQKLARLMGTNNVDHCARLCHSPTVVGLSRAFGSAAMTNPLSDLALSDCVLIIGSNLAENHPPALHWIWAAKDQGADIIVADPRLTPTGWVADEFLQLKPGSDIALLNGMARVIITEGLADKDFIAKRTNSFDQWAASVMDYTPQKAAVLTGLQAEQIIKAARTYAKARAASFLYCMGITQHTVGSDNVAACANLALLTGNIGRPGAGVMPLRGQNNVQGACDMGALPGVLPGYAAVIDDDVRSQIAASWGVKNLPTEEGLTVVEMMKAAKDSRIKAMWIMGEDPVNSDPNAKEVQAALSALEFLVVQDIFLTDTAQMADLVLPAAAWAEKSGTYTNTERRVQWCNQIISPPEEAQPDLWIINEVAKRLDLQLGGDDAATVLTEINQVVPSYAGINQHRAATRGGVHWPCSAEDHPGTPILHAESFATTSGKGQFLPVGFQPPIETVNIDYPLVLTTGRLALHYNSGSMTRRTDPLMVRVSKPYVEIHPHDAEQFNIQDGTPARVITARGAITAEAFVTSTVDPGVVFLPFHFPGINELTIDALDTNAKIPEFKVSACRVEKGGQE